MLAEEKHSSLFSRNGSDEWKKFYDIDPSQKFWSQRIPFEDD
jgi:hypothetical protein